MTRRRWLVVGAVGLVFVLGMLSSSLAAKARYRMLLEFCQEYNRALAAGEDVPQTKAEIIGFLGPPDTDDNLRDTRVSLWVATQGLGDSGARVLVAEFHFDINGDERNLMHLFYYAELSWMDRCWYLTRGVNPYAHPGPPILWDGWFMGRLTDQTGVDE